MTGELDTLPLPPTAMKTEEPQLSLQETSTSMETLILWLVQLMIGPTLLIT